MQIQPTTQRTSRELNDLMGTDEKTTENTQCDISKSKFPEPHLQTEAELVSRASAGDTEAFRELYEIHAPSVFGTASWFLSRRDVEDVVQEIFVHTWRKLHQFQGKSSFKTWLYRLAINILKRHGKSLSKWQTSELLDKNIPQDASSPQLNLELKKAVELLPHGARQVFVLFDIQGFSHREVASMLNISQQTSRSQLHRARMLLRQFLGPRKALHG